MTRFQDLRTGIRKNMDLTSIKNCWLLLKTVHHLIAVISAVFINQFKLNISLVSSNALPFEIECVQSNIQNKTK